MALTPGQKQLIIDIDAKINRILLNKGDEKDILLFFAEIMESFKKILFSCEGNELNTYCQQYDGFNHLIKLLEKFAGEIAKHKNQTT